MCTQRRAYSLGAQLRRIRGFVPSVGSGTYRIPAYEGPGMRQRPGHRRCRSSASSSAVNPTPRSRASWTIRRASSSCPAAR